MESLSVPLFYLEFACSQISLHTVLTRSIQLLFCLCSTGGECEVGCDLPEFNTGCHLCPSQSLVWAKVHTASTAMPSWLCCALEKMHGLCVFQDAVLFHTCASADVGGVVEACLTRSFSPSFIYSELYLEGGQRNKGSERPSSPYLAPLQEDLHACPLWGLVMRTVSSSNDLLTLYKPPYELIFTDAYI